MKKFTSEDALKNAITNLETIFNDKKSEYEDTAILFNQVIDKFSERFNVTDVRTFIGDIGQINLADIAIDFVYNKRNYRYYHEINVTDDKWLSRMFRSEIIDVSTGHDISHLKNFSNDDTDIPWEDWTHIHLIFEMMRWETLDDYDEMKNLPYKKFIKNYVISYSVECYLWDAYIVETDTFKSKIGVRKIAELIRMNHPIMGLVRQYPEFKEEFCKLVECARELGMHEDQLIISEFTTTIPDPANKWEL